MYCRNCGNQLDGEALYCAQCGTCRNIVIDLPPPKPWNRLALWGFAAAIFAPFYGLFACIRARKSCVQFGERGAGLAKAGIILSACMMVVYPILIVIAIGWYVFS